MTFDSTWLFVSLIPSGVGLGLFLYGKKQSRVPQLIAGLLLMVYPFFTDTLLSLVGVGLAIGAALYYMLQTGW